ncbi:hypothetical protein D3870_00420 [Noviherbaspirillum cavernae]|uniref:GNAT family N-acetyltransferase n=1 Tax=Noviherbaspirillum cavernae TaxID=2320862 RepID=A0A418WWX3_9BURK|nr:hypothetical protein [Noviherbaspirillum cavernae]RJG04687.1 hypothetical protein D3870_00420 [Noviherbaspirillum cavernae]
MTMRKLLTRHLTPEDVPALLALEQSKWEPHQAADRGSLLQRIRTYPTLCIGAFCPHSGAALASLFLRPIDPAVFTAPTQWQDSANMAAPFSDATRHRSLFGISLSSNDANAVAEIFRFFYPRALKAGWKDIYLGSPIPGFRKARTLSPELSVWQYAHAKRKFHGKEPLDPQLRYYFRKGFRQIVSIQKNYFPHEESLDYGVILRGIIPLSQPRRLWRITPLFVLESFAAMMFGLAR